MDDRADSPNPRAAAGDESSVERIDGARAVRTTAADDVTTAGDDVTTARPRDAGREPRPPGEPASEGTGPLDPIMRSTMSR